MKVFKSTIIDLDKMIERLQKEDFTIDNVYYHRDIEYIKQLEIAQKIYNLGTDLQRINLDIVMFNKFKELTNYEDNIIYDMLNVYKSNILYKLPIDLLINNKDVIIKEFSIDSGLIESIEYVSNSERVNIDGEFVSLLGLIKEKTRKLVIK